MIQKVRGSLPRFRNEIAGALATFDAYVHSNVIVGGGAAYAFNHVHESDGIGHANFNQEVGVVYSSWQGSRFSMDASCWGGLYQFHSVRNFSGQDTARAHAKGYVLSPHLEFRAEFHPKNNWFTIEPLSQRPLVAFCRIGSSIFHCFWNSCDAKPGCRRADVFIFA